MQRKKKCFHIAIGKLDSVVVGNTGVGDDTGVVGEPGVVGDTVVSSSSSGSSSTCTIPVKKYYFD